MNVIELIGELSKFNPYAKVNVIVHCRMEDFTLTCGSSEGVTEKDCEDVGIYVDRLCVNDSQQENEG